MPKQTGQSQSKTVWQHSRQHTRPRASLLKHFGAAEVDNERIRIQPIPVFLIHVLQLARPLVGADDELKAGDENLVE